MVSIMSDMLASCRPLRMLDLCDKLKEAFAKVNKLDRQMVEGVFLILT